MPWAPLLSYRFATGLGEKRGGAPNWRAAGRHPAFVESDGEESRGGNVHHVTIPPRDCITAHEAVTAVNMTMAGAAVLRGCSDAVAVGAVQCCARIHCGERLPSVMRCAARVRGSAASVSHSADGAERSGGGRRFL